VYDDQVHPRTTVEDLEELSSLLQVPLVAGDDDDIMIMMMMDDDAYMWTTCYMKLHLIHWFVIRICTPSY